MVAASKVFGRIMRIGGPLFEGRAVEMDVGLALEQIRGTLFFLSPRSLF
jgi:hypothetical protein